MYDAHIFHYTVEGGLVFMCMADGDFGRRLPFAFIDDVVRRWTEMYAATPTPNPNPDPNLHPHLHPKPKQVRGQGPDRACLRDERGILARAPAADGTLPLPPTPYPLALPPTPYAYPYA